MAVVLQFLGGEKVSLRLKVAAAVGIVSLCSFLFVFFALNRILLQRFMHLENTEIAEKAKQLSLLVEREKRNLERIVYDWAFWDDTYRFMGGEYPEYVEVNCTDDIFPNLGIDFLGFLRPDGTLVYGKSVDPNTRESLPLPQDLVRLIRVVGQSLSPAYLLDGRSGFLSVQGEVWFFALSWILKSDLSGPPKGFLVMARRVDQSFLNHLSDLFGHEINLVALDEVSLASLYEKSFTVSELSPFKVSITVPFPYASGRGGFALTFPYERRFFAQGLEVARFLLLGHLVGSLGILLLLFFSIERVVVQRVLRLASFLQRVRETGDFAERVEVQGNDEVALVGSAVCALLEEIERRTGELAESEARFRRLFEEVPVGVYQASFGGTVLQANSRMLAILGCSNFSELEELGLSFFRQDVPLSLEAFERFLKEHGEVRNVISTWKVRDGSLRFLRESARMIGEEVYEGTLEDVTEEVLAREGAWRSEMYHRVILEYSSDGVVVLNREGKIEFATSSVKNVTGYSPEELQGASAVSLIHPEDARWVKRVFLEGAEGMVKQVEFRLRHRNGEWRTIEAVGRILLSHPLIQGIVVTIRDVTEKRRVEEELRFLGFRDALTGLYNRLYFEEELQRLNSSRLLPLSIIIGDVNGLKIVNDAFGHAEGDRLLQVVAEAFRASCRQEDVVARWGGDEFAVILPKTGKDVAWEICSRVREKLQKEPLPLPVGIALGWATRENLFQSLEDVVKEAEERMYRAKLSERESFYRDILTALEDALLRIKGKRFLEEVKYLALRFAERIALPLGEQEKLSLLARFHDVGVIPLVQQGEWPGLPKEVFLRRHTESGYFIASNIPLLVPISEAILSHEERWDGKGLPRGLRGEEIPLLSRIVALCVAFLERSPSEALEYIKGESGSIFDPFLAREFLCLVQGNLAGNGAQKL